MCEGAGILSEEKKRDPAVHVDTDKVKFFKGNWREAKPRGFETHTMKEKKKQLTKSREKGEL